MDRANRDKLTDNMIFVGTIYDSFEALEETLGKLKLEKPLFITHVAKMAFAEEVFKRAEGRDISCKFVPPHAQGKYKNHRLYN
ncbi:MAG: hypothetical protein J6J35_06240 [Alphaproteobacteria bacterium]|nr:hypothetical protein [Alphaproteobacteria bacterium]